MRSLWLPVCVMGCSVQALLVRTEGEVATYSLNGTNQIPFTGYSNTLGSGDANQPASVGYVQKNGINQSDDAMAKLLQTGGNAKVLRTLWRALTGAAVGGTATATKAQIQHVQGAPGGVVPIETISLVNRVTTAADRTAMLGLLDRVVYPASYPADLSGNGGGGKVFY